MRSYFPGLLGNEDTKKRIGRAIESGTVPHAFLIGGPSGSGKTTLATEMAAAICCENKADVGVSLPCRSCSRCQRILGGSFPDVKTLAKKKDKATLGVEPVKEFREDMFLSPTEAENKIYIIDDAECMTPEAQNALLKVLEEPPSDVTIILLAKECDRILTTIKSRAQFIPMSRFDDATLAELLLSDSPEARTMKATDPKKFAGLIMSADGRLGYAKALMSKRATEENEEAREEIITLIRAASQKGGYAQIYKALAKFPSKRPELQASLERLVMALRDLIVIKYDSSAKTLFFPSPEDAGRLCGDIDTARLVAIYDATVKTHELCIRNANVSNLIASLASQIRLATNN